MNLTGQLRIFPSSLISAAYAEGKNLLERVATCTPVLAILLFFVSQLFLANNSQASVDTSPHNYESFVIGSKTYFPIPAYDGFVQKGLASWYGPPFHGRKTSNGEYYNMNLMTAAHKTLPMDTILLVKNLDNGKKTFVRVNDRGPYTGSRIIDLSYRAAQDIGAVDNGTARVQLIPLAEGAMRNNGEPPILYYKDLSIGEFYVQIGAFANKSNALRLQKRFAEAGHTTIIKETDDANKILHRVHVYVGETLQHAKLAEKALWEHGYAGAYVIAR